MHYICLITVFILLKQGDRQFKLRMQVSTWRPNGSNTVEPRFDTTARRVRECYLPQSVQSGSGTHKTSYPARTAGFSPEAEQPGREANHFPPCSTEVKNRLRIHPLSHM